MARFLLLLSSIISILVLTWSLSRVFSPKNCINSTLVGKVVTVPEGTELLTCTAEIRLFAPQPEKILTDFHVIQRINRLEELVPYLDLNDTPLKIKIYTNEIRLLNLTGENLNISGDLLMAEGYLERAILTFRINRTNSLSAGVIADFIWQELIEHRELEPIRPWITYLKSLKSYCLSDDRLLIHYDFCRAHNEMSDSYITDAESDAISWSMAPVYSYFLRKIYRESDIFIKKQILENLMFVGEIDETFIEEIKNRRDPKATEASFFAGINDWLMPLLVPENLVTRVLADSSILNNQKYNYVYISRSSQANFPLELNPQVSDGRGERHIVQYGTNQYYYPSDVALKFAKPKLFKTNTVKSFIYVSCHMPDVQTLLQFDSYTQQIIYLRQCEPEDIDWSELYKKGLDEYVKANEEVQFVEFNLSALKLAQRLRGPLKNSDSFSSWQRWLLWQRTVNDQGYQIQRPLSAIDGVGRFRIY